MLYLFDATLMDTQLKNAGYRRSGACDGSAIRMHRSFGPKPSMWRIGAAG
jgi:hypothetical protein